MKRDKDWIDAVRSSLRDAEPAPPAGGWERLERDLGMAVPPRGIAWRIYWPRIAVAAAVLLFVVAGGELLLREEGGGILPDGGIIVPIADSNGHAVGQDIPFVTDDAALTTRVVEVYHRMATGQAQAVAEQRQTGVLAQAVAEPNSGMQAVAEQRQTGVLAQAVADDSGHTRTMLKAGAANGPAGIENDTQSGVMEVSEEQVVRSADAPEAGAEQRAQTSAAERASRGESAYKAVFEEPLAPQKPRRGKTSFGLFGGGGVSGGAQALNHFDQSSSGGGFSDMDIAPGEVIFTQRLSPKDFSYRHHLPLSFGLTVRKEFAHGLSLESGVNYTLLRSDVRARNSSKELTQQLHFIGVPLRANWQFLERGRFSLYIGAGGMLEKCVSARFGADSAAEESLQWSVTGAAGAQYRLGGVVGLYFEPEVSYYFTQTELHTSRTESPLSFALRLGVRLSF